ncbi:PLP-dependent aminotransferase family protein [Phreatobacter cathodiphilus]|uniref:PLP-dependent aminotransferase family protein n=1 Tax=Phreatobacter cathodiphilus TaxID=1868589 RepID=A0A2S0NAY0_9HYPH|nr:PLP-dependent aminotransferase family protein [Phreatobacter cathodiphilus]AVO45320.1 PLP-dependent aminotransferase family protein [Phreatobacter cathodiphilus]
MRHKPSRATWSDLLHLALDPAGDSPIFQQIYLALREAIVANTLAPGGRLPSSRALALRLGVSRTSVVSAYDQLLAEGYVVGRGGSGTYVSDEVPAVLAPPPAPGGGSAATRRSLSVAGARYGRFAAEMTLPGSLPFAAGCCSVDAKTVEDWRRIGAGQMRRLDPVNLSYADPSGEPALRREIAAYLRAARAVRCDEEQVVVLSGAQQAIDLSIRTLLDPGDPVWIEDPGYGATREALAAAGAALVPVPVDEAGLDVAAGMAAAGGARAAYITPSHQYPTGAVMSMARRLDLLAWAAQTGAWIIEDDYDSEFRYAGRPLASLQGLDRNGCVVYVGTLSKVLFPGIRLGFAVVPHQLVDVFRGARFLADRSPPTLQQAMTAEFMRQGLLVSHIRRMRQRYKEARDVVVEAIGRHLGDLVDIEVPDCGIQLVVHFRDGLSDIAVTEAARRQGLVVKPVSPHYLAAPPRQGLVLGYSGFDAHRLRAASAELGRIVRAVAEGPAAAPSRPAVPRRAFAGAASRG